jgi:hypothetical protein
MIGGTRYFMCFTCKTTGAKASAAATSITPG